MRSTHEVRSWCNSLGVTEAELRLAVRTVGYSAQKVSDYLHTQKADNQNS
jgi:hypothetical protein